MSDVVISAADQAYFGCLQMLTLSIRRRAPSTAFEVVDLGLAPESVIWLRETGVRIHTIVETCFDVPKTCPGWQTWNKPVWIERAAEGRVAIWLDADCLVVRPLRHLFDAVTTGPVFVAHRNQKTYPAPNDPRLYVLYPVAEPHVRAINAGVIGINGTRDVGLLSSWRRMCRLGVGEAASLVRWMDEGALAWAIRANRLSERISSNLDWNRFVWSVDDFHHPLDWLENQYRVLDQTSTVVAHYSSCRYWARRAVVQPDSDRSGNR